MNRTTDQEAPETQETQETQEIQEIQETQDTNAARKYQMLRDLLDRIGDKWTMSVLQKLDENGTMRFTELRDHLGNISQKMLTKTLRNLERDGFVTRRVYPVIPPHVEYTLTPLGETLSATVCILWDWVDTHVDSVDQARLLYDQRTNEQNPRDG